MCFGNTERKKETNSRRNERKREREKKRERKNEKERERTRREEARINPKWKSANGTRVFLNGIWMYVLNLL